MERAIESFDMRIVVALSDAGVPVCHIAAQQDVREARREFGTVIGLDHFKQERGVSLGSSNERGTLVRTQLERNFCMRPPGIQVDEGVHVEP